MQKINNYFKGKNVALPKIGCGLCGLNWVYVKNIIEDGLNDCNIFIVEYDNG